MPIFDIMDAESTAPTVLSDKGADDFEKARKKIFGVRNKSPKRKSDADISDEKLPTEKELDKIFAGENWEEISSLYFNARYAVTGYDGFLLSEAQKKVLGLSLSSVMRMLLKIDPGYIAMVIFLTNFGGILIQKEMIYKKLSTEANGGKSAA